MQRIALASAVLLFAAGCGSSNSTSATCDNFGNALTSLPSKYSACGQIGVVTFDKNQCVQIFDNSHCTDADRQKFNDVANCINALPNCTPATQASWETSYTNCVTPLASVNC